jgi:hypothetical protein
MLLKTKTRMGVLAWGPVHNMTSCIHCWATSAYIPTTLHSTQTQKIGCWAKMPFMKDRPIPLYGDHFMSHVLVFPTRMDVGIQVTMEKCVLIQQ